MDMTDIAGHPPLDLRVLSISLGVAGAYTTRLLADLGAVCSTLRWQQDRPGDWPDSRAFRSYFDHGVEAIERTWSVSELLHRLPALAAHFDLVIADFSAAGVPGGGMLY